MPNFSIVDTHIHLWNPDQTRLSWLEGDELLYKPFELTELTEHTKEVSLEAFVFVEAAVDPQYTFLETDWMASIASQEPRLKGIIAGAPLEHGRGTRYYLEKLAATSSLVKGVRRVLQDEPDPFFCLSPDFLKGVQLLPEYGFSFDICIYHHQLAGVIELVKRCPETSFILDHIAKPNIKNGELEPWRVDLQKLATFPNIVCKVSGLVTEADHNNWNTSTLAPYFNHVLEVFGDERVMFGSDWPVMLRASSYYRWIETLDSLTSQLTEENKHKFWADNARRYYRL